jgi:hypothetical protein
MRSISKPLKKPKKHWLGELQANMEEAQVLRSYSKDIRSEGLQPQLVCCAPFPSITQYFRTLYLLYPKIQMAIIAYTYLKVHLDIGWKYKG